MSQVISLVGAEISAPTTLETADNVSKAKVVRVVNTTGSNATLSTGVAFSVTTSSLNASLQNDITLDALNGIEVGDTIVGTGIPASTTVASIAGTVITLSAALTQAIDGTGTPVSLSVVREGSSTTLVGSEVLYIKKKPEATVYASASSVTITPIAYPR